MKFCPECGTAVGPYNNIMPYIRIFSYGEVYRVGVGPRAHFTPLTIVGHLIWGSTQYGIFFPFYLFRVARNFFRQKKNHVADSKELHPHGKYHTKLFLFCAVLSFLYFTWVALMTVQALRSSVRRDADIVMASRRMTRQLPRRENMANDKRYLRRRKYVSVQEMMTSCPPITILDNVPKSNKTPDTRTMTFYSFTNGIDHASPNETVTIRLIW